MEFPFKLARDDDDPAHGRHQLSRLARRGELTRLQAGVYLASGDWAAMERWQQDRARIDAAALRGTIPRVLSHQSAAAVWCIPYLGGDGAVHLLTHAGTHGRNRSGIRWHGQPPIDDVVTWNGYLLTSRAQTAVDIAATAPFHNAVATVDHVLRPDTDLRLRALGKAELYKVAGRLPTGAKKARARRVIDFADPRSGSAGESLSRAQMHLLGFPPPRLQHRVEDLWGLAGLTDFYWPGFRLAGEFDGALKYSKPEYLAGRTSWEAVIKEKEREDRIRATGIRVVRWNWAAAFNPLGSEPAGLKWILREAGLPQQRPAP